MAAKMRELSEIVPLPPPSRRAQRPPRVARALAAQLREHPPSSSRAASQALARSLAYRLDNVDRDAPPGGVAQLARALRDVLRDLAETAEVDSQLRELFDWMGRPPEEPRGADLIP
jgi:hypothetical protein